MTPTVRYIDVDTTKAEAELEQLQAHAATVNQELFSTLQKTYSSLVLLGNIFGEIIPQWFNSLVAGVFMAAQTYQVAAQAAAAATVAGATPLMFSAALMFLASSALFAQALQVQIVGDQVENKLNSTIALMNTWT